MATSFMSNLRKPKSLSSWAPTGEIGAGESDPYSWAKDMLEREYRNDMANFDDPVPRSRRGNVGRLGASMSNPDWGGTTNSGMQPMDVVYDQRPEMFQKQLNFQKDQAAQKQKNIEAERIVDAMAANDDYIQNRRNNELKQKQVETQDWAARNLKPGELGEREKMQIDFNNRHALDTAKAINDWVARREANAGAERVAGIRSDATSESAAARAAATTESASIRAAAMEEAARIRAAASGNTPAPTTPATAPAAKTDEEIFKANAAELQGFMGDDELRKRIAQNKYGDKNVPLVSGLGSGGLGGTPGSPGLRGNAPIDANATATPYAANANNQAPRGDTKIMRRRQRNQRTGEVREQTSIDGGVTWR